MKMFDTGKTRMIGLPYGGKTMTICYMVLERNGQTDRFAISILRVSMLTRDKNSDTSYLQFAFARTEKLATKLNITPPYL